MERITRGLAATISTPLPPDGDTGATAPDSATVQVLRADGTELIASTAATESPTDSGTFTLVLTPTQTADLDTLTARWTYAIGAGPSQTVTTTVEIAGAPLFTLSEARALDALTSPTDFPAATIIKYRTLAEQALEDACETAFVPRYARETLNGSGLARQALAWQPIRSIRDVTIDDVALTTSELADVLVTGRRFIYREDRFASGVSNVVVGYEYGEDTPPERVRRACLLLAKTWLIKGPIDDRATAFAVEGADSIPLLVPGRRGVEFGIPEVDAVVQRYAPADWIV